MEAVDLQLENVLKLANLKFSKNAVAYKKKADAYLTTNLNLYNSLPNSRSDEKAQYSSLVKIGIMENIMSLLGSEEDIVQSLDALEKNSKYI